MQYRVNKEKEALSLLGYGCLRFPKRFGRIDKEKTKEQIALAVSLGINYFDTAYIYKGSEAVLGECLKELSLRDQVNIATKLPHYLVKTEKDFERYFTQQLKKLRTNRVEYYLMHMLPDVETWERLKKLKVMEWLEKKKKSGQIKYIGFSYHGNTKNFCELLDVYPWDFCQIQYNYLDEHSQAGRKGLHRAADLKIPVIIMEPLRGGRLANLLPKQAVALFSAAKPSSTPAEWAFRWLYDQPEVTVVLSGMNSKRMILENAKIASKTKQNSLTQQEKQVYEQVKKVIARFTKVDCTGCGYCMPCPKGVDIPGAFRCLNVASMDGAYRAFREYFMCTAMRKTPSHVSLCVECGACEKHCPQKIPIRKKLKEAAYTLEGLPYRISRFLFLFRR